MEKKPLDMYLKHSNSYIKSFLDDYLSNCLSNELTIKAYLPFVGLDWYDFWEEGRGYKNGFTKEVVRDSSVV